MKSRPFHGVPVMVALLSLLILAAQTKTASNYFENTSYVTPTIYLSQSFEENVQNFTRTVAEFEDLLHSRYTGANRLRRASSPTKTEMIPQKNLKEVNRDISILINSTSLDSQDINTMKTFEMRDNTLESLLNDSSGVVLPNQKTWEGINRTIYETELHLDKLLTSEEENEKKKERMKAVANDIIWDIQTEELSSAAQKLQSNKNVSHVYIVKKAYDHNSANFELLLQFGDLIQDLGQKLKIYSCLFKEMRTSGHTTNSQMLSELCERIKTGVLDRTTSTTFDEAQSLLGSICTQDILRHLQANEFALVQQRLKMGNNHTYEYAVKKVYQHAGGNFNLLIRFAQSVNETEIKLKLYKALYSEMGSSDRNDKEELHEFTQRIKTDVLDRATGETFTTAQSLLDAVCTEDITQQLQSGGFTLAVQMLQMGNDQTFKYAVNKVYNHQVGNFESILRLGNSTKDVEKKLKIYDALYDEMRASGRNDSQKLLQLKQTISTEILDPATGILTIAARSLLDRINCDEIIGNLLSGQFALAEEMLSISKDNVYVSVMKQIHEQGADNFDLIRKFGDSMQNMTNQLRFFEELYKVMKSSGANDTRRLLQLGQSIKTGVLDRATGANFITAQSLFNHIHYDDVIRYLQSREFALAEEKLINCTDDVYKFVVKEAYDQQDGDNFELLLSFAASVLDNDQKLKLHDALFYKIGTSGHENRQKLTQLSQSIEKSILSQNFNETSPTILAARLLLCHINYNHIIAHLQSGEFALAEQKLMNSTDDGYMFVVQEMYNVSSNFELLLGFAESIRDASQKLKLYRALHNKMRTSSRNDTQKLIQLSQSIKKQNLHEPKGPTADEAQSLLDSINCDEIIGRLQSGEFSLAEQLLSMGKGDAYSSVVKQIYEQGADNFDLIKNFGDSMQNVTDRLKVFEALYKMMKPSSLNDTQKLLQLGQSIKTGVLDRATGPIFISAKSLFNHVHYDNIINRIQSREFALAEQDLLNCTNDAYKFIVKEVFVQEIGDNFELLLSFAKFVQDVGRKLKLYDALYHEMRTRDHNDDQKFIQLSQRVREEILDQIKWKTAIATKSLLDSINHDDIISNLQARKFDLVQEKFLFCTDDVYTLLVKQIIDQQPNNFELLLEYANSTQDAAEKFKVYNVLYEATKNISYKDDRKKTLLRLYSSMKKELNVSSDSKNHDSLKSLFDALKMTIVDKFALSTYDNFIANSLRSLFDDFSKVDVYLLYSIYDKVIEMVWSEVSIPETLNRMSQSLNHLMEQMAVHEAIINKLERTNVTQTADTLIGLAKDMKRIMDDPAYDIDVPQEWRSRYEDLKNKLPALSSIRNLVFSSKVCIRNIAYKEYIHATDNVYDKIRRYVKTSIASIRSNYKWTVDIKTDNRVYFRNVEFNEYLHSDKYLDFDSTRRWVFTHLSQNSHDDSAWRLEVNRDGIYIKGYYNEYLFANNVQNNYDNKRYVFTYRSGNIEQTGSNWQIEDCDDDDDDDDDE